MTATSVGGLLAPDLRAHHPERFRAVISLEGALKIDGNVDALVGFWHLRSTRVDTSKTAVHILTGEYDYGAPIEAGRAAHEAIEGSTFTVMEGLGHFPMSEDPEPFLGYLLPVLRSISTEESR